MYCNGGGSTGIGGGGAGGRVTVYYLVSGDYHSGLIESKGTTPIAVTTTMMIRHDHIQPIFKKSVDPAQLASSSWSGSTLVLIKIGINIKETRSVTINIFRKKYFLFKSFVKIESSYVFTINMYSTAENCMDK